jgi:hypothetical protein
MADTATTIASIRIADIVPDLPGADGVGRVLSDPAVSTADAPRRDQKDPPYSSLNATVGSSRDARRAGR